MFGWGSPMYWAVDAPILGDTQTQDVAVLAIYIRLFCTANVAVIAAITAKLQFLQSCKIAAITAKI